MGLGKNCMGLNWDGDRMEMGWYGVKLGQGWAGKGMEVA